MKITSIEKVEDGFIIRIDDGRTYIANSYIQLGRKIESLFNFDNALYREGPNIKTKNRKEFRMMKIGK